LMIVIVNLCDLHAFWKRGGAVQSGYSGDNMLAGFEQIFRDASAAITSRLYGAVRKSTESKNSKSFVGRPTPTMATFLSRFPETIFGKSPRN